MGLISQQSPEKQRNLKEGSGILRTEATHPAVWTELWGNPELEAVRISRDRAGKAGRTVRWRCTPVPNCTVVQREGPELQGAGAGAGSSGTGHGRACGGRKPERG